MTIHRTYRKKDPRKVHLGPRDCTLVAVDPGKEGVALFWSGGVEPWPRQPGHRCSLGMVTGHAAFARKCRDLQPVVLVVEDQYVGPSARAAIDIVRSAALAVGQALAIAQVREVIWAQGVHWQKRLPKGPNAKTRSRVHAARLLGEEWLATQGSKELQQACADAVGLAAFYEEVTRGGPNMHLGF